MQMKAFNTYTENATFSIFYNVSYFMNFDALVANKGVTSDFPCKKSLFYN